MLKLLIAASVAAAPLLAAADDTSIQFVHYPLVHKISCDEGSGTGFRVGLNHWMSVAHVTEMHHCVVANMAIAMTEQSGNLDFSRFDTPAGVPNGLRVNCHGFVPGHWYWAVGHAKGLNIQTAIALYATFAKWRDGKRILLGEHDVIPGMSGGPIFDENGEVVGTVNAYVNNTPISLSRELKDTDYCGANIA